MDDFLSPDATSQLVREARESSAGWLIQRLAGQLDRAMDQALEPHGLNIQSFAIVMTALEHDGLTQKQIGSRFKAPAYTITRSIDGLEKEGFLERRPHPTSRRTNTVHPSQKARELAPQLVAVIRQVNERLLSAFAIDEAEELRAHMRVMLDNNELAKGP
ncbi:MAG: MarR family winged helix-turn-helix transcriptional regulator [Devosiaceae bacterium]